MYFVRPSWPKAAPVFQARTFRQTVNWCLAAEKSGVLGHSSYEIIGADSCLDELEFMATFLPGRSTVLPPLRNPRGQGHRRPVGEGSRWTQT